MKELIKDTLVVQRRVSKMALYVANEKGFRCLKWIYRKILFRKYHIIISNHSVIGNGLYFPHPQNIVIGGHV